MKILICKPGGGGGRVGRGGKVGTGRGLGSMKCLVDGVRGSL